MFLSVFIYIYQSNCVCSLFIHRQTKRMFVAQIIIIWDEDADQLIADLQYKIACRPINEHNSWHTNGSHNPSYHIYASISFCGLLFFKFEKKEKTLAIPSTVLSIYKECRLQQLSGARVYVSTFKWNIAFRPNDFYYSNLPSWI